MSTVGPSAASAVPDLQDRTTTEAATARLRITEIFHSIQGESRSVGMPTVFIRLTGCPLRCTWCDTEYAFTGGEWTTVESILAKVARFAAHHVCVTGGEPLAQKNCLLLLRSLCDAGYTVSLETSGAIDISDVDARVCRVVDIKAPGSGEAARNRLENLLLLRITDQVKFVIADRQDYEWACKLLAEHRLEKQCEVLFSPVYSQMQPRQLAEWILADRLQVRFQVQLHKVLWGEQPGV